MHPTNPWSERPAVSPDRPGRLLGLWLGLGALAVVLAATPSALFELDRFAIPKEFALQLTALGAVLLLWAGAEERSALVAAELPLLGFAAWSAVSALFATNRWLSMRALALTLAGVILFRGARRVARLGAGAPLLIGLTVALVAAALTGLAQAYGLELSVLAESRAPGGTLGNRNFLAHLLVIGLPLILLLYFEARSKLGTRAAALALALMFAAIVLTRSRAAWLGGGLSGAVMACGWLLAGGRKRSLLPEGRRRLLLATLTLAVAAAILLPNRLAWRSSSPYRDTFRDLTNYHDGSGHGRLIQYRNSLRLVPMDPVLGTGPGNWPVRYPLVTTPGDPSFAGYDPMPTNPWPSSDWVAMLTERGAVATLLLLASFAVMALTAARRLQSQDPAAVRRALALLGLLTASLVTGAFDAVLLLAPPTLLVWAAAGLLLPPTGELARFPYWLRKRRLFPALALAAALASAHSAAQLKAIGLAGPGWPVQRLKRAVRYDPGNYRLQLMIAERTNCAEGRSHAEAAARLFPALPAPRRRLAACGGGKH